MPILGGKREEEKKEFFAKELACRNCGYFRYGRFSDGDYVGKPDGECPKCGGELYVSKIFRTDSDPNTFLDSEDLGKIREYLGDLFDQEFYELKPNSIHISVEESRDLEERFFRLVERMKDSDYTPFLRKVDGRVKLVIAKLKLERKRFIPRKFQIFLLLATLATTTIAGYMLSGSIPLAFAFSISLMTILGSHEIGHYLAARRHGMEAELPVFIPAPPIKQFPLGTFGAVMLAESPIPNRKALFDVGVTGPLIGFIVAVIFLAIGIHLSKPVSPQEIVVKPGEPQISIIPPPIVNLIVLALGKYSPSSLKEMLIFVFLSPILIFARSLPQGYSFDFTLSLHPIAFAGWIGVVVTMLNLMPAGQLDGGHFARSLSDDRTLSSLAAFSMVLLLLMGWLPWIIIVAFLSWLGHPGPLDDVSRVDGKRKIIGLLVLLILFLSLSPIPIIGPMEGQ